MSASVVRAQRQASSCVIYGGWRGRGTSLLPSFFSFPLTVLFHNCFVCQRRYAFFVKLALSLTNTVLTKGFCVSLFPRKPVILPKIFHCFPQPLEATSRIVLTTSHCPFLSHSHLLIVPIIRQYTTIWLGMFFTGTEQKESTGIGNFEREGCYKLLSKGTYNIICNSNGNEIT